MNQSFGTSTRIKDDFNTRMSRLFSNNRTLVLAYDHGMEHGPSRDFNMVNYNPNFLFSLAEKTKVNALVTQIGIAEKYAPSFKAPIIVKLNGKTDLTKEMVSRQVCSINRAMRLDPIAVGYTIYPGSANESIMFSELSNIIEQAHNYGVPVVVWSYPRNKEHSINDLSTDVLAYAARVALELGADVVKLKFNNDLEGFRWVVHNAGLTKVVVAGGKSNDVESFLESVVLALKAGANGLFVGRNVWQNPQPESVINALKDIIFNYEEPHRAYEKYFKK